MKLFLSIIFIFASILFFSCKTTKDLRSFEAMNTFMTLQTYGSGAEKANSAVINRLEQIEGLISVTRPESDIFKLNENGGKKIFVHPETFFLAQFCLKMAEQTDGALNPVLYSVTNAWGFTTENYRVPENSEILKLLSLTDYRNIILEGTTNSIIMEENMKMDFGAVGKGFAGDEAIKVLKEHGIKSAILDLGGNIQVLGAKPDGSSWTIGIKNPWGGLAVAGVKVTDKAVITSGGYERFFIGEDGKKYIHIFDGKTGYPVENELESVTVICKSGLYGDSLSTSLFVMGSAGAENFWEKHRDFEMVLLTKEKKIIYTVGLKDSIKLMMEFSGVEIIE